MFSKPFKKTKWNQVVNCTSISLLLCKTVSFIVNSLQIRNRYFLEHFVNLEIQWRRVRSVKSCNMMKRSFWRFYRWNCTLWKSSLHTSTGWLVKSWKGLSYRFLVRSINQFWAVLSIWEEDQNSFIYPLFCKLWDNHGSQTVKASRSRARGSWNWGSWVWFGWPY